MANPDKVKIAQKALNDFISDPRNVNEATGFVVSVLLDMFLAEVRRVLMANFQAKHPDLYGVLLAAQVESATEGEQDVEGIGPKVAEAG